MLAQFGSRADRTGSRRVCTRGVLRLQEEEEEVYRPRTRACNQAQPASLDMMAEVKRMLSEEAMKRKDKSG